MHLVSYKILRFLLVLLGLAALGDFGRTFYDFWTHRDVYQAPTDLQALTATFRRADKGTEVGHLRPYADYAVISQLNITGKVEVEPAAGQGGPVAPPPLVGPEDVEVPYIQFQPESPESTFAFLRPAHWQPPQGSEFKIVGDLYQEGDVLTLPSKPGVELEVVEIRLDAVVLRIRGKEGSEFTIRPRDFEVETRAVRTAGDGAPEEGPLVSQAPARTRTRDGRVYEVGTDDLASMESMSEEQVLAAVRTEVARDPATGEVRGLKLSRIRPDSVFARQGLQQDDIVLSVNGHPARSRKELMDFLRQQGEQGVTTFTLRVDRRGHVRDLIYRLPRRR